MIEFLDKQTVRFFSFNKKFIVAIKMQKTIKNYVSEIDQKLVEFDATHKKSASQLAEIAKYEKIHHLRDQKTVEEVGLATSNPEGDVFKDL